MSASSPGLTFLGGAGTVTGSKALLDTASGRILLDCGLFQGMKHLRVQNWAPFPVPPESVDAVVLTHAHVDHCGYVPRLARFGFRGPVFCTEGTKKLAEIVLPDSGHLQEEEARFANRKGYSKHDPAEPLYTKEQALAALDQFVTVTAGEPNEVLDGLNVTLHRVGHILGAASVELHLTKQGIVARFSGDLGRSTHPLLLPPAPIERADMVVIESTYGDESHLKSDPDDAIVAAVMHVVASEGVLIIPAFAVDRTEVVLWHLDRLIAEGLIPNLPVFVDSPMACRALDLYEEAARGGAAEIRPEFHGADLFPNLRLTDIKAVEESKGLNDRRGPMIVVSASGMATGGRVVHHLAQRIGNERNAVLLVGFQAPGTRGDALATGAKRIKMFGQYYPVRAPILSVELSAHADREELVTWVSTASPPPGIVYVNHGEPSASETLARTIEAKLGVDAVVPHQGERVRLDPLPTETRAHGLPS